MTRPNYKQYGRRAVVWCSYPEANHPLGFFTEFESLIPSQGSQWRQDRLSSFNSVDRHSLYFVPNTQRSDPESDADKGTISAFILRELWEEFQAVSGLSETYMVGFDYATGAGLGEYRTDDWEEDPWRWAGETIYKLRADFLQSFSPALIEFNNQTPPRWASVTKGNSGPIEDKNGQPEYITLHFDVATGNVLQARVTSWYHLYDNNINGRQPSLLMHNTDAPLNTDWAKVAAMAAPIPGADPENDPPLFPHAYKVDTVNLPQWQTIQDDRQVTNTWENLKPFILHSDTGLSVEDSDII